MQMRYVYEAEESVRGFFGPYRFLSNFWTCDVPMYGEVFRSSEHAYMYHKSKDEKYRKAILKAATAKEAKRIGRDVELREDWEQIKFSVMTTVVGRKFACNPALRRDLIKTELAYLEETNTWNDTTWGVCHGVGANHLGRILMATRYMLYVPSIHSWMVS
jgi:ribA/ribD-fused uncharacterized protein